MSQNFIRAGSKALRRESQEALLKLLQKAKSYSTVAEAVIEESGSSALGHLRNIPKSKSSPANLGFPKGRPRADSKEKPEKLDPTKSKKDFEFAFESENRADSTSPFGSPSSPSKNSSSPSRPKYDREKLKPLRRDLFGAKKENDAANVLEKDTHISYSTPKQNSPGLAYQLSEKIGVHHSPYFMQSRGLSSYAVKPIDTAIASETAQITINPSFLRIQLLAGEYVRGVKEIVKLQTESVLSTLKNPVVHLEAHNKLALFQNWVKGKFGDPINLQMCVQGTLKTTISLSEHITSNAGQNLDALFALIKFAGISGFGLFTLVQAEALDSRLEHPIKLKYTGELASQNSFDAITGGPNNGGGYNPVPNNCSEAMVISRDESEKEYGAYSPKENANFLIFLLSGPAGIIKDIIGFISGANNEIESQQQNSDLLGSEIDVYTTLSVA